MQSVLYRIIHEYPQSPRALGVAIDEFQELQQRLNAAVGGECQFVVVAGEPGIGKTRLFDELDNLAHARKIRVLHGRSVEQDRSFPYQGFCELIQEFFRLKDTASAPPAEVSDLAPDLVALFPMLSEIAEIRQVASGVSAPRPAAPGPENRTKIFELLARTLTRLPGGRPLVLMLEDLHAAEVSIEALQYVVRRLGPTPTLVLGTYRTTEVDARHSLARMLEGFQGDRRFALVTLAPFSPSDHRLFLETLVGGPRLAEGLVRRLYEGTEGSPFFTKELVRSLLDSGGIARDDTGAWSLSDAEIATEALPATIQQAVEKRIERLPEELREVLAVASVAGRSFDARDLEKLTEGRGDVEEALDRLIREGYLEEKRESRGEVLAFSSGVFAVWDDLGVEVEVRPLSMPEYLATFAEAEGLDLLIGRWNADYDDPDNFTHMLFHGAAGRWHRWFSSEACDRVLEEARTETRPAVRESLYRKVEGMLREDHALVPLFHDVDYRLASPKVGG